MSILDRNLGHRPEPQNDSRRELATRRPSDITSATPPAGPPTDEQAVERYRYLLRTAPPEAIEQAHAEAFDRLTPAQRRLVLQGLNGDLPPQEQADRDDPRSLARLATRAELRRPGTLERTFGGMSPGGTGIGLGGLVAVDFLSTVAAVVVGTAIAEAIFDDGSYAEHYSDGAEAAGTDQGAEAADAGYDGGEAGYDAAGDVGGDLAGGDFGGGEF
jgi:hypothetical protein